MRGEIAFEPALRERVALLEGLPLAAVDEIIAARITLTPGGRTLVRTMRAHGAYTCLVSGGFTLFTGPIAKMIGFDEHRANRLVVADETLAGRVEEPILGREAKRAALDRAARPPRPCAVRTRMAVGDGANDLAMLGEAGLGVAFRAKPAVAAAAARRDRPRRPHGAALRAGLHRGGAGRGLKGRSVPSARQQASLRPFAPLKARHPGSQAAPAASATILKQGGL